MGAFLIANVEEGAEVWVVTVVALGEEVVVATVGVGFLEEEEVVVV